MKEINTKLTVLSLHGYIQVPYEENLEKYINDAMDKWKKFHEQPLSHKLKFVFSNYGGYEYKGPENDDYKEDFHVSIRYNKDKWMTSVDIDFINSAKVLIEKSLPISLEAGSIIGSESNLDIKQMIVENFDQCALRFLYYPPRDNKKLLAIPHVDKGITIHLAEDAPGLEILWGEDHKWKEVLPMHNHAIAYSGLLGQYYTMCKVPALCHRVNITKRTVEYGRNSIVLFLDFGNVVYDKKRCGRTQIIFSSGENYSIPFDVFKTYFTDLTEKVL